MNDIQAAKPLIAALQYKKTSRIPIWLMRQAGRYLPEYRELRAQKNGFLDMAYDPGAACEITMQPIRRFALDAAIIFSDILVVPHALGQDLWFEPGHGPKLGPLSIDDLKPDMIHVKLDPVYQALKNVRNALAQEGFSETALIGFAGSPWTVACYMVDGGGSKDFGKTKTLAYGDPQQFQALIDILVEATSAYLIAQIEAGAEAVQIFDSWAGILDARDFDKWVITPNRRIVEAVKTAYPDIPVIGFPRGAGLKYAHFARETGVYAVGLDQMVDVKWAADTLQGTVTLQGNLDPFALRAGGKALREKALYILDHLSGGPFVFNLGHGVNKETPPSHVQDLVTFVREYI